MVDVVAPWPAHRGIKWSAAAPGEIPAWVAEMDFEVAPAIRDAVTEAVQRSDLGYAPMRTDTELAEAVSRWYGEAFGWQPEPGRVVLLPDVIRGVDLAIELWTAPGEGVVATTPVYHPFLESIAEKGRVLADAPLSTVGGRATLDLDAVGSAFAAGARLLLLCHPHNPTGTVFSLPELEQLAELVLRFEVWVVSDEVHAPLLLPGSGAHVPFASLGDEVAARTLTLTSASKAWNIPGLKCAVAVAGSPAMHHRLASLPATAFFGGSPLGVHATLAALRDGGPWLREVIIELDDRRHLLDRLLRIHLPEVGYRLPDATYLAWLDCRGLGLPASDVAGFFRERAGVWLSAGEPFGTHGEGRVRLNFATSADRLTLMVERMSGAVHHPRTSVAKK